jgi:hypothetical protein
MIFAAAFFVFEWQTDRVFGVRFTTVVHLSHEPWSEAFSLFGLSFLRVAGVFSFFAFFGASSQAHEIASPGPG